MAASGVDLAAVLASFDETWSPRTVATLNDYDARVVHTRGEFTPHSHPETDELFLVLSGRLTIRLDDGDVTSAPASSTSSRAACGTSRTRRTARTSCCWSRARP